METMARFGWRSATSLIDWLQAEPFRFEFFQAARLVERSQKDCAEIGEGTSPESEPIYFSDYVSHKFPPSDIVDIQLKEEKSIRQQGRHWTTYFRTARTMAEPDQPQISTSFMGLAGHQGPLPEPIVDEVIERVRRRDYAFRDFLDIFNNRLIALLFKAKRRHRLSLSNSAPWKTPFATYLFSLIGIGTPGLNDRMGLEDKSFIKYAHLFAITNRSAHGLERLLSDFIGAPVRVRQFKGKWVRFDNDQLTSIGPTGQNGKLGIDVVIGSQYWSQNAGIEIEFGPLTIETFSSMLPGRSGFTCCRSLAQFYLRDHYDMQFRLILKAADRPLIKLDKNSTTRLGWSSWLSSDTATKNDGQVCLCVPPVISQN